MAKPCLYSSLGGVELYLSLLFLIVCAVAWGPPYSAQYSHSFATSISTWMYLEQNPLQPQQNLWSAFHGHDMTCGISRSGICCEVALLFACVHKKLTMHLHWQCCFRKQRAFVFVFFFLVVYFGQPGSQVTFWCTINKLTNNKQFQSSTVSYFFIEWIFGCIFSLRTTYWAEIHREHHFSQTDNRNCRGLSFRNQTLLV